MILWVMGLVGVLYGLPLVIEWYRSPSEVVFEDRSVRFEPWQVGPPGGQA